MKAEILRLFKAYLGEKSVISNKALEYGLFVPTEDADIVDLAIDLYGKDGLQWNQTFHKNLDVVANASDEQLIIQQMLHYITTYGFEELGIFDNDTIYIPNEELNILTLEDGIELICIKPIDEQELTEKLMTLLTSGIALSKQTVKDIMVLSDFIDKDRFDEIKNREIKNVLYDKYNIVPKNPDEFLRYLIFKTTALTLKIKDKKSIQAIKNCDKKLALSLFNTYLDTPNNWSKLSSIFLRNKEFFLAYKGDNEINSIINRLRKLANKHHNPMKQNILDNIVSNPFISIDELSKELSKITIFREIRILNAIRYASSKNEARLYKVRNGRSFVPYEKECVVRGDKYYRQLELIKKIIEYHLSNLVKEKLKNKVIYLPNNIVYTAPTSEKQFVGNIPQGSYLDLDRNDNILYGIHWNNLNNDEHRGRVDLDIHQMNATEMFGWNTNSRDENRNILFTGDIINAPLPNGATELFYVNKDYDKGAFLLTLNMFTRHNQNVPFELVVAKTNNDFNRNYVLDPNEILSKINMEMDKDQRQQVLGLVVIDDNIRFYFNDFGLGNKSVSSQNKVTMGAFNYLKGYNKIQLTLNELLELANVKVIDTLSYEIKTTKEIDGKMVLSTENKIADIDLSINAITKESIIKLLN